MNKMVRNLVKVAVICAASVLVLASCSKKDINASREMEERYSRASAEIENSAPRSSSEIQKVEVKEVVATTPETVAPAATNNSTTPAPATQPAAVKTQKVAKKNFIDRAVERTVINKIERYVEKHPELKQKYEGIQGIDPNLKLAIIFALIAILLGFIAGVTGGADIISTIFWIASIVCWVIAIYYLIMWVLTL